MPDDGAKLLTSLGVESLLSAAITDAGGALADWALDHVDSNPDQSTTATYAVTVDWPFGRREELLLGVSARANGLSASDTRAKIFADGDREVAVWLYPDDPDLPGLAKAASSASMAEILTSARATPAPVAAEDVELELVGYRPRRRAVLRASVRGGEAFFLKVLREQLADQVAHRHRLLTGAGVPSPEIVARTADHVIVLRELAGQPLAQAVFDPVQPCTAASLIEVLDAMPAAVASLDRRPPWADSVAHYARIVGSGLPEESRRLDWLVHQIDAGLSEIPPGNEPTHGDFHEGQVHVAGGRVVGILDIDTIGPGRRADDLACLIAHLSTIQRMNAEQTARVQELLRAWVPVFDERVDPVELRLRAAAVVVSLATGPFRGQEPDWQGETTAMIDSAEALVRQVL